MIATLCDEAPLVHTILFTLMPPVGTPVGGTKGVFLGAPACKPLTGLSYYVKTTITCK